MTNPPPPVLRELLTLLRGRKADCAKLVSEPQALAAAYRAFILQAPSRTGDYLSRSRNGIPSSSRPSNRQEEHLAIALYNAGTLPVAGGGTIIIADYQMPLKAAQKDKVGKVDLVGVDEAGRIVVIELKVATNREDRRVALVEALGYAAAIEANAARIAGELSALLGQPVRAERPSIVVAAPPAFWAAPLWPPLPEMRRLASGTAKALATTVELLSLEDATLATYGLLGSRPTLRGNPYLGAIPDP